MRTESVKCPARAVFAKSRARTGILCHSIYLQVIKVHWFKLFDKPGLLCSLASDYRWITTLFRFSFKKPSSADFEFQLILYSRVETARHLVRSDFFLQRSTQTLKYVDEFPEWKNNNKNWRNSEHTHISLSLSLSLLSLSLYLSIRRWNLYFDVPAPVSLSLSLYICKHGLDPDQTRMVFRQFKNVCMRWKVRKR